MRRPWAWCRHRALQNSKYSPSPRSHPPERRATSSLALRRWLGALPTAVAEDLPRSEDRQNKIPSKRNGWIAQPEGNAKGQVDGLAAPCAVAVSCRLEDAPIRWCGSGQPRVIREMELEHVEGGRHRRCRCHRDRRRAAGPQWQAELSSPRAKGRPCQVVTSWGRGGVTQSGIAPTGSAGCARPYASRRPERPCTRRTRHLLGPQRTAGAGGAGIRWHPLAVSLSGPCCRWP